MKNGCAVAIIVVVRQGFMYSNVTAVLTYVHDNSPLNFPISYIVYFLTLFRFLE